MNMWHQTDGNMIAADNHYNYINEEDIAQDIFDEMDEDEILDIAHDLDLQAQDSKGNFIQDALEAVFQYVVQNIDIYQNRYILQDE